MQFQEVNADAARIAAEVGQNHFVRYAFARQDKPNGPIEIVARGGSVVSKFVNRAIRAAIVERGYRIESEVAAIDPRSNIAEYCFEVVKG